MRISRTVLSCGGETYRADECCMRILYAQGAELVEVVSFPTVIMLTVRFGEKTYSRSESVRDRTVNLRKLDACIALSRGLTDGTVTFAAAKTRLDAEDAVKQRMVRQVLLSSASATCFAVVFGGSIYEVIITLIGTLFGMSAYYLLDGIKLPRFISYFAGAALIAIAARIGQSFRAELLISVVITSGIMPMLPGLIMTNAMRDSINGDIVSTAARVVEALMTAVSIAAAVGIVLMAGNIL